MTATKQTIMVVDDDPNILRALSLRLKMWGYNVITSFDGADALLQVELKRPDLIITDVWMPAGNGFALAYRLKQTYADIPIIFLSASKQSNLKEIAKGFEAIAYLEKPYEPETLAKAISAVLPNETLSSASHETHCELPGRALVG
jgi:two-component system, NtrC family, response regulator GlrR